MACFRASFIEVVVVYLEHADLPEGFDENQGKLDRYSRFRGRAANR
jgi:hypothetical protein